MIYFRFVNRLFHCFGFSVNASAKKKIDRKNSSATKNVVCTIIYI